MDTRSVDMSMVDTPSLRTQTVDARLRLCMHRCAAEWKARPSHERRAVIFVVVFFLLVSMNVMTASSDSVSPGAVQVGGGVIPKIGCHPKKSHQGVLVADVSTFFVTAAADNDGFSMPPMADPGPIPGSPAGASASTGIATGKLHRDSTTKKWTMTWDREVKPLRGMITVAGRGMELSTLQYWREGRLFSCDDRSGIIYELIIQEGSLPKAIPRYILPDGDGSAPRGMRCEWSTVKGDMLMVGSTGKPRTDIKSNVVINQDALWVKSVSPLGEVRHNDWSEQYGKLRRALGITGSDGYVIHECAAWSRVRRQWVFVPRHVSSNAYNPADEDQHGSTVIILTDASFANTRVVRFPPQETGARTVGVTECKFVPSGRDDELVLVKVVQRKEGGFESLVSIVGLDGTVVMEDSPMPAGWKFEALELRPLIHSE